jgi:hypothetical protein
MKTYDSTLRDQFYRDNYIAVDILELHLTNGSNVSDPLYLCSGGFNITVDTTTAPTAGANTYTAQGDFMGFSPMTEDFDVRVGKFSVYLSGVGNEYVTKFTQGEYEGKRVIIYKVFLEFAVVNNIEILQIVSSPIMMFDGIIYNIQISESSYSCQINVDCSSLFADFERSAGRKSNNGSNHLFQGNTFDTCMEKAGYVGATEINWGKA